MGSLGHNNKTNYNSPKQVGSDTGWDSVEGGWDNIMYYLKENGTLWACGQGQMGLNQPNNYARSSPVQIPGTTWTNLASYSDHVIATKNDGTLWAWGDNGNGQLGQSNYTKYSSPVQIPGSWEQGTGGNGFSLGWKA